MNIAVPLQVGLMIATFLTTVIWGAVVMPILKRINIGQNIREDGPPSHLNKSGTPSLGGIIFLGGLTFVILLMIYRYPSMSQILYLLLLTTLAFGLIGFVDDYLKVLKKHSVGLRAWQKVLLILIVSGLFVYYISEVLHIGAETYIPIFGKYIDLGRYFIPFALLVLLSTTNVVNITDGLDGLAAGIMVIVMAFFTVLGIMIDNKEVIVFCSILTGACLGFLVYNINPAKIFMGDTGSLALGGAMGAVSLITQMPIILFIVAGVCVAEALSDIIQVIYFKTTHGKRVFKMAPLHHHFELSGWSEQKVVWVFWGITLILSGVGVVLI